MDQKAIDSLYRSGQYAEALSRIPSEPKTAWADTMKLRCLRSLKQRKPAVKFAERVYQQIKTDKTPYSIATSERNHLLRYIALVYSECGKASKACQILEGLLAGNTTVASLHREYGFALLRSGKIEQAEHALYEALKQKADDALTHSQLGSLYCSSGRLISGYDAYVRAATLQPNRPQHLQNLTYWSNFLDDAHQQSNHQLSRLWANKIVNKPALAPAPKESESALKVGFLVGRRNPNEVHVDMVNILPLLGNHDVSVLLYCDLHPNKSTWANYLSSNVELKESSHLNDDKLAAQIIEDSLDIVIDFTGHAPDSRLLALAQQCAPIQINWAADTATTGLPQVQYRIGDRYLDPLGGDDSLFSESLLRLRNGCQSFAKPDFSHSAADQDESHEIHFAYFGPLSKISKFSITIWCDTLHAVENSKLVLWQSELAQREVRDHFIEEFRERGIEADRLLLKHEDSSQAKRLEAYKNIHITLDSYPFSDAKNTLESLWMGIPVVTLKGESRHSRYATGILSQVGISSQIAENPVEYISIVEALCLDRSVLQQYQQELGRLLEQSTIMNPTQLARDLASGLKKVFAANIPLLEGEKHG